jgi:hypothetical protein
MAWWIDNLEEGLKFIPLQRIWIGMVLLQKRIRSTRLSTCCAFGHEIRKFANVATGLKHSVGCHGRAGNLNNVAKAKPVVQPTLIHTRAHSATDRPEVIQAFGASVDFEGG